MLLSEVALEQLLRTHALELSSPLFWILTFVHQPHFHDVLTKHVAYAIYKTRSRPFAFQKHAQIGLLIYIDVLDGV